MSARTEFNTPCPYCGKVNEVHVGEHGAPKPGDVSLCWTCGQPGIYTDDLSTRKPDEDELAGILANPEYQQAVIMAALSRTPDQAARRMWDTPWN